MYLACELLISAVFVTAAISPADRNIEEGVARTNLARLDQGTKWTAIDACSDSHTAAKVFDGEVCDLSGGGGYWAGNEGRVPVTMELAFPRPTAVDANLIVWYATDIRGVNYKLEGLTPEGKWVELYHAEANRYRDIVHRFPSRTVTKVRFTLESTAGQGRVVMREFLLYDGLTRAEEKTLMANAAKCLGPNEKCNLLNLGVAVKAVTYDNTQGTVGPSPEVGHAAFYMSYYNSGGAELLARDCQSKKVYRYDLPGTSGGYGLTTGADGKIYVGTVEGHNGGSLMQFDPKSQTVRNLGKAGQPTTYIWQCAATSDGKIFGAGYPKCIPLVYDIKTDKLTSPGSIAPRPGTDYLRCTAVDAKGRAWFGVGNHAALVVYDPADGSTRNVLPEKYASQSTVYSLLRAGDVMVASINFGGQVLVFDAHTCEFLREIPCPPEELYVVVGAVDSKGTVYASGAGGDLYAIQAGAPRAEKLAPFLGSVKSLWEDRYLHAIFDNEHRIFDLQTREIIEQREWIEPKTGMRIYCLTGGPEGNVYGSTFINQHFFRYNSAAEKLEDLGVIIRSGGQCDSMGCSRDGRRLWMGSYTRAHLSVYDPSRPYKLGSEPDCNPRDFGPVGKGQYRTRAIVEGPLGKIYVGSVPSYQSAPTGALTIFDPKTLEKNVITDFVPGGTVHQLAASDEFVYGAGGGELFILDPKTGKKVNSRKLPCGPILIASDGALVVCASDGVQGLDPKTLETRWNVPFSQVDGLRGFHRMAAGPGGELYGVSDLGIFRVDAAAGKLIRLTTAGSPHLAVDKAGRLYFSQGASLYMYDPRGE